MKLLGGINRSDFLSQYWQQQPLLIRQAYSPNSQLITTQELFELATKDAVESRWVQSANDNQDWQCRYGPFTENELNHRPKSHWSLLVQGVDHHLEKLGLLLEDFDFIPNWRIDDVMISTAAEYGSVGPHVDNYDVFLLQARGQRRWSIHQRDFSEHDFIEGLDMNILKEFSAEQSWDLGPGDMLYLPPGVAHHGIALEDDCITISIGFRAPEFGDMMMAYIDEWHQSHEPKLYTDPEINLQAHPGEILTTHVEKLKTMLSETIINDDGFAQWLGRYLTSSDQEFDHIDVDKDDFIITFKQHAIVKRRGDIRVNFIQDDTQVFCFIAGQQYTLDRDLLDFARYASSHRTIEYSVIAALSAYDAAIDLLHEFYAEGWLYFDE